VHKKTKKLPSFQKVKPTATYASPEELFYALTRKKSHAYLRGQQQDVLRAYQNVNTKKDIGFELPTGTGKTAVGLLVAEWKRRTGKRAAYLVLTNQLAAQVLEEAERLGVTCADLRGTKEERSAVEEGRYSTGEAIGVSTYANLFNIKR
jgi:superfamily II DNA or RNA helicase